MTRGRVDPPGPGTMMGPSPGRNALVRHSGCQDGASKPKLFGGWSPPTRMDEKERCVLRKTNNRVGLTAAATMRMAAGRPVRRLTLTGTALGLLGLLGGCNLDKSFMDPSVAGRWEPTPTIMPILDRIAAIEDDTGQMVEFTDPVPGDLIPLPVSYRIGAGDQVDVTLYDLIETNRPELYEVVVDARGFIELPQLGRLNILG